MSIVRIYPQSSTLEEVARHRAKLCHGVAKNEETQFIANPNPPNTIFEVPSYFSKFSKGFHQGHIASIPPQNFQRPSSLSLWNIQHTPTYAGAHFSPTPQEPPAISIPLDLDNPEILDGKLEIEKVIEDLYA